MKTKKLKSVQKLNLSKHVIANAQELNKVTGGETNQCVSNTNRTKTLTRNGC